MHSTWNNVMNCCQRWHKMPLQSKIQFQLKWIHRIHTVCVSWSSWTTADHHQKKKKRRKSPTLKIINDVGDNDITTPATVLLPTTSRGARPALDGPRNSTNRSHQTLEPNETIFYLDFWCWSFIRCPSISRYECLSQCLPVYLSV